MNENKNHIIYTAADIRQYVQGKLSPQQMHAMEKAALEDPFLADAIEGMQEAMQEHGEPVVTGQLDQLRNQLQTRTTGSRSTPVIAFRWWQAAAAAVIVIAGALWIYNFTFNKEILTVATQEKRQKAPVAPGEQQAATDSAPAATGATTGPASATTSSKDAATTKSPAPSTTGSNQAATTTKPVAVTPPEQHNARAVSPQTARANAPDDNKALAAKAPAPPVQEAAPPVAAKTDTVDNVRRKQIDGLLAQKQARYKAENPMLNRRAFAKEVPAARQESLAVNQPAAALVKKTSDFNNRETELITIVKNDSQAKPVVVDNKNLSGVVKGRVTDPFHNPVANAYVTLPNNANYNMLTDKTGYFKLPAHDSVVDVAVNVVGYGTQNFRLQNNASLNELQLQPANAALNEVVVTKIEPKAKRSKAQTHFPKVMVQDAEPVYGWLAYEQYLEKNKQRPADYPELTGNVVVSFTVNKKGELSNFNIEQSLAKPYDEEAIRLISQGPAWKLVKGRKAKITVIVKF